MKLSKTGYLIWAIVCGGISIVDYLGEQYIWTGVMALCCVHNIYMYRTIEE